MTDSWASGTSTPPRPLKGLPETPSDQFAWRPLGIPCSDESAAKIPSYAVAGKGRHRCWRGTWCWARERLASTRHTIGSRGRARSRACKLKDGRLGDARPRGREGNTLTDQATRVADQPGGDAATADVCVADGRAFSRQPLGPRGAVRRDGRARGQPRIRPTAGPLDLEPRRRASAAIEDRLLSLSRY